MTPVSSLPGLTRQSIENEAIFAKKMDTRVKPAYDEVASINPSLILFAKMAPSAGPP